MTHRKNRNLPFVLACLLLAVLAVGGCSQQQIDRAKAARQEIVEGMDRVKAQRAVLAADLATRPADDPARPALERSIKAADSIIAEYEKRLPAADAAIAAAEKGELTPELQRELEKIPVVGPYITLILSGLGLAGYFIERHRRKTATPKPEAATEGS